jgi:hypothetical protein
MILKSPWPQDIVDRLNTWQSLGFCHPYACSECRSDLTATTNGWKCSEVGCAYTQDWAHEPPTTDQFVKLKNELHLWMNAGEVPGM